MLAGRSKWVLSASVGVVVGIAALLFRASSDQGLGPYVSPAERAFDNRGIVLGALACDPGVVLGGGFGKGLALGVEASDAELVDAVRDALDGSVAVDLTGDVEISRETPPGGVRLDGYSVAGPSPDVSVLIFGRPSEPSSAPIAESSTALESSAPAGPSETTAPMASSDDNAQIVAIAFCPSGNRR